MSELSVIIGAGFSKLAGLPLAKEIGDYFTRNNVNKLLKFSSGEWKWVDFADDTDKHNGSLYNDHLAFGYILNAFVDSFIVERGAFSNYEDFYQFVIDNQDNGGIYNIAFKKSQEEDVIPKDAPFYLQPFKFKSASELKNVINHLLADLLYWRIPAQEIDLYYSPFVKFVTKYESANFITLNHDLLLEYLLEKKAERQFSDGFTDDQNVLKAHDGTRLKVFHGEFKEKTVVLKLHGSVDVYKYSYFNTKGALVETQEEYLYYKTHDYWHKQMPERFNPETGEKLQSFHFEVTPQFITGTRKNEVIKKDVMYSTLYSEFEQRIQNSGTLLIIGYSFCDEHINEGIKKAINLKRVKIVININPTIEFPFNTSGINVNNIKTIKEL